MLLIQTAPIWLTTSNLWSNKHCYLSWDNHSKWRSTNELLLGSQFVNIYMWIYTFQWFTKSMYMINQSNIQTIVPNFNLRPSKNQLLTCPKVYLKFHDYKCQYMRRPLTYIRWSNTSYYRKWITRLKLHNLSVNLSTNELTIMQGYSEMVVIFQELNAVMDPYYRIHDVNSL